MIDYITAASLVIGLGGGFIAATIHKARVVAGLNEQLDECDKQIAARDRRIGGLQASNTALIKLGEGMAASLAKLETADAKRRADARLRDDRYRARQAEKRAARYAKTHAELAGIVAEKAA